MKIEIMGVPFDNVTMDEAISHARELLAGSEPCYCVTPNSEIVYEAMRNPELLSVLRGAAMVLPDGAGVVLASKLLKTPLKEKVAGVDFADRLLALLCEQGGKAYLLGSAPGIAEQAAAKMIEKHPGLQICGMADGYFKDAAPVIEAINASEPDVLFVCLGAPKQEKFMAAHAGELKTVRLMAGLGGSLDGFAGTVKRAPKWMIRLQLEWLYRLIKEPRRIGRMMRLPKYVILAWKARIKGGSKWES